MTTGQLLWGYLGMFASGAGIGVAFTALHYNRRRK